VKILYFAWLRERLDRGEEEVSPPSSVATVADLIAWLRERDPAADLALARPQIIRAAVDARLVPHSASLVGARVVALFPPMTGG
jgi:molybdopterin synthase sulfur carrier subunit